MSVDGYVAGPGAGPDNGLGTGGEPLHNWVFDGTDADKRILEEALAATGAVVMGRNLFDVIDGPHGWTDEVGYGAGKDELLVHISRRGSIIDAFQPYLHQRWNEGCTDAAVLYQEIRQRGFTGSDQTVRRYVRPFRTITTALPVPAAAPKTRHVAQ